MTPAWQQRLKKSIVKNKRDAHNRYFQLATVAPDGMPRARMVVFRGFSDDDQSLLIITDRRSEKVSELSHCSRTEIGWYFTHTREQYRLRCDSQTFLFSDDSRESQTRRAHIWNSLSEAARAQFFWKTPGVIEGAGESPALIETAPDTFAVVAFTPFHVDHLVLSKQQSRVASVLEQGQWSERAINP